MLGTIEEIKAKMDGNVLSLFDFLESDGKSGYTGKQSARQERHYGYAGNRFPLRLLQWTPSHQARRL